jgi:hypothetical protein
MKINSTYIKETFRFKPVDILFLLFTENIDTWLDMGFGLLTGFTGLS